MPTRSIMDRLRAGEVLLMDGGTGSEIQRRGADVLVDTTAETELRAWSATANMEFADVVLPTATLIPHQLVASMSADIVEGAYVAAVVAGHQEVGVTNLDMAVAEIARLRNVVRVTDLQPAFTKYSVAFPLEILFGQKPACRQRPGVEFGVACRPPFLFSSEYWH